MAAGVVALLPLVAWLRWGRKGTAATPNDCFPHGLTPCPHAVAWSGVCCSKLLIEPWSVRWFPFRELTPYMKMLDKPPAHEPLFRATRIFYHALRYQWQKVYVATTLLDADGQPLAHGTPTAPYKRY